MRANKSQHVTLFMPSFAGGGAERMMLNLASEFITHGVRVSLVLATATGEYSHLAPSNAQIVDLRHPGVITAVPSLARYLWRERPTAMLVTLDHAAVAAVLAARLAGNHTKVFVRQACGVSAQDRPTVRERILPLFQRVAYPFAERIIAVSQGVATDVHNALGVAQRKITVLANPVLTSDIDSLSREQTGHPWLDSPSTPVILGAGRFHRQKGFDTLLDAFAIVHKSSTARLVLLGEGQLRDALATRAANLGLSSVVSMPGFVRNPFAFMARASVFALASRWEGLPGVLLQAMACGCPVVSTDCPSGPREILTDPALGPLVPVDDAPALAQAMLSVLANPPASEILREAVVPYSSRESGKRYLDVLTSAS